MKRQTFLWGTVAVLLVAAALRLVACGDVPPGLYHDEAIHGLDALDVLRGDLGLYFPANNGREPLFIYLVSLTVGLLGQSPFALRLTAVPVGLLTVAATAALGRVLFSHRVGLLAAAVLAVTLWHVHLSRVAFRAVLLPLFVALVIWLGTMAWRTGKRRYWLAAGLLYGLSFYTYTAARFTPVALASFGLCALLTRATHRRSPLAPSGLLIALLAALLTLLPLAAYTIAHPDVVLGRLDQVALWHTNGTVPWRALVENTLRTAGMFFVRGDRIWRHNIPYRPVFDPLLGAAFVIGLLVALHRARRDPSAAFVLVWTGVMTLPTLLAVDAPHFLRAVGVLPVVALLPALGLDALLPHRQRAGHPYLRWALAAIPLLIGLTSTAWAYFGQYAHDPTTAYWFEEGAAALGGRINRFLGTGWDGERMLHGNPGTQRVYVAQELWSKWPQARFLVARSEWVVATLNTCPGSTTGDEVAVFAWPYDQWQQAWRLLPLPAEISVEEGPLSQGDNDPQPYTTYVAFLAAPPPPETAPLARFGDSLELVTAQTIEQPQGGVLVRLRWHAAAMVPRNYTVFVHYLRDGELLAQADGPPASGYLPTAIWRTGDVIDDDHYVEIDNPLPGRDTLRIGLWQPQSGEVLPLVDQAGSSVGEWIIIPVGDD